MTVRRDAHITSSPAGPAAGSSPADPAASSSPADPAAGSSPAGPAGRRPSGPAGSGPGRRPSGSDPGTLAEAFAHLFCEVEAGRRPRRQLRSLMSPTLYARLGEVWVRPRRPGRVVRVAGKAATRHRYEAVAVIERSGGFGALGLSLVRGPRGWRVEDAIRPEDGPDAPPDEDTARPGDADVRRATPAAERSPGSGSRRWPRVAAAR